MKVRFIQGSLGKEEFEDLCQKNNIDTKTGKYEVLGYGSKVFVRVGNKIIDVFPSRLEIVDEE